MIIETCPKCGHDLQRLMLACSPPIPKKECWNCGWSWTGKPEKTIRVPFNENKTESIEDNCYEDFLRMGYSEEVAKELANLAVNSVPCDMVPDFTEAINSLVNTSNCVDIKELKDLKQAF